MLDRGNSLNLISLIILITCLLDYIIMDILRDKSHVNHLWEVIGLRGRKSGTLTTYCLIQSDHLIRCCLIQVPHLN